MLTTEQQEKMYRMVEELYHHFGLDGSHGMKIRNIEDYAKKSVLKWKDKRSKKDS